ncbi:hypothetical protein BCM02_104360 [Paenibacillus methanolicus]|uniref:Uncharacterized protein n=1 Tax=Paenibacillus methanolicus TaxID=582686 RepID=A0A5S5C932_9BACL|nr:hypothetical protein BCM02_104360 [Paenibacillus methanolicus]
MEVCAKMEAAAPRSPLAGLPAGPKAIGFSAMTYPPLTAMLPKEASVCSLRI